MLPPASLPRPLLRMEARRLFASLPAGGPRAPAWDGVGPTSRPPWGSLPSPSSPFPASPPLPTGVAPSAAGGLAASAGGACWAGVSGRRSCAERGGRPREVRGGTAPAPESAAGGGGRHLAARPGPAERPRPPTPRWLPAPRAEHPRKEGRKGRRKGRRKGAAGAPPAPALRRRQVGSPAAWVRPQVPARVGRRGKPSRRCPAPRLGFG